jgi:DNA-binding transcriptional MocR family regulator
MGEVDFKVTPRTRVGIVMDALHERIANRSLVPGVRVPSIRMMADALGVSKSTVVEAYDRLAGEGVLVARPVMPHHSRWPISAQGSTVKSIRSGLHDSRWKQEGWP